MIIEVNLPDGLFWLATLVAGVILAREIVQIAVYVSIFRLKKKKLERD